MNNTQNHPDAPLFTPLMFVVGVVLMMSTLVCGAILRNRTSKPTAEDRFNAKVQAQAVKAHEETERLKAKKLLEESRHRAKMEKLLVEAQLEKERIAAKAAATKVRPRRIWERKKTK